MRRVLIVDDSPTLRRLLATTLEGHGWSVETAEDAERGATRALSSPPDVVISDLWMPGLSGLQLCQLLRGDPVTAHVPVVLLSSSGDRRSRFWAVRSGASAFLDKGDIAEVPAVIDRLRPAQAASSESLVPELPIRPSSIPGRLSHLLDRSLFEAVVAGELRALAFVGSDIDKLFAELTRLLADIMEYVWLALAVTHGGRQRVYVHQHLSAGNAPVPAALDAVGVTAEGAIVTRVLHDEDPAPEATQGTSVVSFPIELHGRRFGTLAVMLAARNNGAEEVRVLALAAREVALPIHAVTLYEESKRLAATDALTGLANRRQGAEALAREVARFDRRLDALCIALVDIDHFKRVNDTFGHAAGDRAICHVTGVLQAASRSSDMIARWGGEEFLVILTGASKIGARLAAERMRAALARSPLTMDTGATVQLTVSIGLAVCTGQGVDALLDEADRALYRAKSLGRDRVAIAAEGGLARE